MNGWRSVGVRAALASALLFGAGTPLAKLLLGSVSPFQLAGLLYLGSGLGLGVWRLMARLRAGQRERHPAAPSGPATDGAPSVRGSQPAPGALGAAGPTADPALPSSRGGPWSRLDTRGRLALVGAIALGGVLAPVLLLVGLANLPASGASLLLNAEGLFTALVAWVVFRENVDRRVALGMVAIVAGAVVLTVPNGVELGNALPSIALLAACLCWGIDNNLTRMVSLSDATWLAAVKGLVAGPVNLLIAFALGARMPGPGVVVAAMAVGLLAYGISLALFVVALRHVGTARAGAYFSVAPFLGAVIAVLLGEPVTVPLVLAGALMALGVWLHLTERHVHAHAHPALTHEHTHVHDDGHHDHQHSGPVGPGVRHSHPHAHPALTHAHEHFPDAHHRHSH